MEGRWTTLEQALGRISEQVMVVSLTSSGTKGVTVWRYAQPEGGVSRYVEQVGVQGRICDADKKYIAFVGACRIERSAISCHARRVVSKLTCEVSLAKRRKPTLHNGGAFERVEEKVSDSE